MWKEISIASLVLLMSFYRDAAAFTGAATARTSVSRTNSPSVLFESFNDEEEYAPPEKKKGFFANFFDELDAFVDDATSRRLGNGAQYYGKRKSSFYGKDDANRKKDKVRC